MRRWRGVGATSLTVVILAATAGVAGAQPLFSSGQDPVAGTRLFTDKGCANCHTIGGKGGVGPDLSRTTRPRTFYDLAAALWNHAPQMATAMKRAGVSRPKLSERDSGHIAAYLFTLDYFDPPGNADQGRRLFTEKRCVTCHRIGGRGGAEGPALDTLKPYGSPIALASAMWNHGPAMAAAMAAKGIERPTFQGSEMLDLIAYINRASPTLPSGRLYVLPGRVTEGLEAFTAHRCVECHAPSTSTGPAAIDLGERQAHKSLVDFAATMWNKAPAMTDAMKTRGVTVPRLSPQTMADIVAYLYSVRYFADAGDPRRGVIVAQQKGCFNCHGLYGERGKPASDLAAARGIGTPAGVLAALWNHSFVAAGRAAQPPAPSASLTAREMADLVAYLRSLTRARP
jgi:mono/diheme cytochrome c family protein